VDILPITPPTAIVGPAMPRVTLESGGAGGVSFENLVGKAVQDLADQQARADQLAIQLATGDDVSLVDVVLAMEETSLGFKMAMQVRNKAIEAYHDVMRMQM